MHLLSVDDKNLQLTATWDTCSLAGLCQIKRQVKSPPLRKTIKKSVLTCRPDSGACTGSDLTVEVCSQVPLQFSDLLALIMPSFDRILIFR